MSVAGAEVLFAYEGQCWCDDVKKRVGMHLDVKGVASDSNPAGAFVWHHRVDDNIVTSDTLCRSCLEWQTGQANQFVKFDPPEEENPDGTVSWLDLNTPQCKEDWRLITLTRMLRLRMQAGLTR